MQIIRKWIIIFLLLLPVMLLVGMRVGWFFLPKKPLVVLAIDKTWLTSSNQLKQPLFWILKNEKFVRKNKIFYDGSKDYLGLFPIEDKQYRMKDFQNMSDEEINHVESNIDATFYIGNYGVTADKINHLLPENKGMTDKDLSFLVQMKKNKKLILAGFNIMASPTKANVRRGFENEFGIRWTGWIGRYFSTLDSTNSELPLWLLRNYKKQHNGQWPFEDSGIVLVSENGTIEVLDERELISPEPIIHTFGYGVNRLGMQKKIPYSYWFDIIQITDSANHAISVYELQVNEKGRQLLNNNDIPTIFPAVIMHKQTDYEFYYFCGNYCEGKIPPNSSYFIGGQHLALMLDGSRQNLFFFRFFRPMLSSILQQYYDNQINMR